MEETTGHCHKAHCEWIRRRVLTGLQGVPPLMPNPELSGIGVVLGFSITAYLTMILLYFHYITVHDYRRTNTRGKQYINYVDRGILDFVRERVFSWKPSRRFEFAMEKAVLILSDTQLVTGLAILISGYSQLNCSISAYHWQVMVYVAWFSSFSFLAALSFLEGYFQTNNSLRILRVFFMFMLASLLIVALIPTGSHNWLNLIPVDRSFYPSLEAICYYRQLTSLSFNTHKGPKLWSMIISILMVGISYLHSGVRLFDPTAEASRRILRVWPGSCMKRALHFLEERSTTPKGLRFAIYTPFYLSLYAIFASARALYDFAESMLLEIIWLSFAVAWGSIKLYDTRKSAGYNSDAEWVDANEDVLEENSWSFGQILPLVLLLLPILCMAQAYLDNDAKAADAAHKQELAERNANEGGESAIQDIEDTPAYASGRDDVKGERPDSRQSASCSITRCDHYISLDLEAERQDTGPSSSTHAHHSCSYGRPKLEPSATQSVLPPHEGLVQTAILPRYPYKPFSHLDWYHDHILLYVLQTLVVACFALFLIGYQSGSDYLGLSIFLRSRLFILWLFGMIPAASLLHLFIWFLAASLVRLAGCSEWLMTRKPLERIDTAGRMRWLRKVRTVYAIYFAMRMILVCGMVIATFFMSFELAGPSALVFGGGE